MNTSSPTPPASTLENRVPGMRATNELAPDARPIGLRERVIHSLARRPPLTGVVVLEYGVRYAAAALRGSVKWTLYFAAAGLVTCCAVLGAPGFRDLIDPHWADCVRRSARTMVERVMATRSPDRILRLLDALIEEARDADIDRVLALTPEQIEAELRAAGFDVEAEKAKAAAWLEKLSRGELPGARG